MAGRKQLCRSAAEAVAGLPDGATIMVGGFAGYGVPQALMDALLETGAKDLTLICNDTTNLVAGKLSPVRLVEAGMVRKVICSFPVPGSAATPGEAELLYRAGKVAVELVPQGTLAERIRCGGHGIPAFFTPTGAGTPFAEGKEVREFEGMPQVLETALTADFAFVRAHIADSMGNLKCRLTAKNFNPLMAAAATTTVAEVDQIVEPGSMDPEAIDVAGVFVQRLFRRT